MRFDYPALRKEREGWGTWTGLWDPGQFEGKSGGIPHLAKNERDVGHPAIGAGIEPKSGGSAVLTQPLGRPRNRIAAN